MNTSLNILYIYPEKDIILFHRNCIKQMYLYMFYNLDHIVHKYYSFNSNTCSTNNLRHKQNLRSKIHFYILCSLLLNFSTLSNLDLNKFHKYFRLDFFLQSMYLHTYNLLKKMNYYIQCIFSHFYHKFYSLHHNTNILHSKCTYFRHNLLRKYSFIGNNLNYMTQHIMNPIILNYLHMMCNSYLRFYKKSKDSHSYNKIHLI